MAWDAATQCSWRRKRKRTKGNRNNNSGDGGSGNNHDSGGNNGGNSSSRRNSSRDNNDDNGCGDADDDDECALLCLPLMCCAACLSKCGTCLCDQDCCVDCCEDPSHCLCDCLCWRQNCSCEEKLCSECCDITTPQTDLYLSIQCCCCHCGILQSVDKACVHYSNCGSVVHQGAFPMTACVCAVCGWACLPDCGWCLEAHVGEGYLEAQNAIVTRGVPSTTTTTTTASTNPIQQPPAGATPMDRT